MITNIDELAQNEAVAYLKADLCLSDPDNYSLDEKREICEEMAATSGAIEEAMRKDFSELPPERLSRKPLQPVILSEAKDLREAFAQMTASRGFFAFGSE